MKTPFEWEEGDLQSLVKEKVMEGLHLEYKDGRALMDSKKDEISKDVSAFANADGGTIIYGISENSKHEPENIGGVDPSDKSHEWLEQIIHSRIQPIIPTIKIKTIKLSNSQGKVVYIVDVPKGNIAHQASDKKFYRRRNFSADPMHAYEIIEVNKRSISPDLEIELSLQEDKVLTENNKNTLVTNDLKVMDIVISNRGEAIVENCLVWLYLDTRIEILNLKKFTDAISKGNVSYNLNGKTITTRVFLVKIKSSTHFPIWEGEKYSLFSDPFELSIPRHEDDFLFIWKIAAHGMKKKNCSLFLKFDPELKFLNKQYHENVQG